ncbi:MAG: intradiol ring-cleavage dioxygenase [Fimbriimonadaceae bacterium]
MEFFTRTHSRRDFFQQLATGAASLSTFAIFKEELLRLTESGTYQDLLQATPQLTEGPFYPNKMPLDKNNDLILIGSSKIAALGQITHLTGKITDRTGAPIKNATIEIWQVDGNGVYLHTGSDNGDNRDPNFQGFGQFETDSSGTYKFRTVKPVAYPGRAPHIHFKVKLKGQEVLTSQILVAGDPGNARDGVLRSAGNAESQRLLIAAFNPHKDSKAGELEAKFNVILGITPEDNHPH